MMACSCKNCDCGKEKKIKAYFCPSCKSTNVKYVFELRNLFGVLPKMRCLDCKTEMASFPILTTNEGELKKTVGKKATAKVKAKIKNGGNKK